MFISKTGFTVRKLSLNRSLLYFIDMHHSLGFDLVYVFVATASGNIRQLYCLQGD